MSVTSLYFLIILEIIKTSETILIYMLVDFRAIETFVNQIFVNKHQINGVVNVVLYYKS